MTFPGTDPRLFEALASLNQIGATINRIGPDDLVSDEATLELIVDSATRVVPGSSAVIYYFDRDSGRLDVSSRVSAGDLDAPAPGDDPRPGGLGARAILQRRRVISYEETDLSIHPVRLASGVKVAGCFPLIVAEQMVGVLYVYLHEDRLFTQLELLMLDTFVNQAAMTIYHSHRLSEMRRDLARKDEELLRLRRAALLISSRTRLEETLESILQMALEVTDAHYGILRLLDKSGQMLLTKAIAGVKLESPLIEALPVNSNSVMGRVARTREPILISDLQSDPWARVYYPLDANLEMRSELAVPLVSASGRLEGVLNLESPRTGAFTESDSHLLQSLATQAVTAIQEVRLLDALQEIAQLLIDKPYEQVLERLVERACDLLNASASSIWLLKGDELVMEVASGGYKRGERVPLQDSLTGLAVTGRAAVIADDVRTDPRFHRPDLARSQNWARAMVVPLATNARANPVGAFSVYSSGDDPGRFAESEWDKKVLTCLAYYAVLAIQNAANQDALRSAQEQRLVAETFAAVGDIASNLLHHLNNKVGTIPVRVQGIEDKCQPAIAADPYLAHNLDEIERCATEAMETVRENLSHLRPIHLEPVYVAARVMDALNSVRLPQGVRVSMDNLDDLPVVVAGGRSLTFVFSNLLENAAAAMGGEGSIHIRGDYDQEWVEVSVNDSGPGIAPDLHDRVFELNFSGRSGSRAGKLGFGLWWVKTLMTRLGGSVTLESDGQHGATFHLRLPRARENR